MRVHAPQSKWLLIFAIMTMGVFFALGLFATSAFASEDSVSPWVIKIDPKDLDEPETVDVDADYQDLESGVEVDEVVLEVPDAVVTGCTRTSNHVHCKATKLTHGDHDAVVKVKDKSGNTSSSSKRFRYDKAAPVIDSIAASTSSVDVKYHDTVPSSGVASIVVTVDGVTLDCCSADSDRKHDWANCTEDTDGHTNGLGPTLGWGHCVHGNGYGYGHDQDADSFDHLASGCSSIAGTTSCDGDDIDDEGDRDGDGDSNDDNDDSGDNDDDYERDHSSGSVGLTCPILGELGCGSHQVVVTITDRAGNVITGTAVIENGVCDLTPPTTTDNAPAGWQNADVTVGLACTDNADGSGCASTSYEVDGGSAQTGNSVSLNTEGVHTITYRSTDNAGNVEATQTATVMIDKTPPTLATSGDRTIEATAPNGAMDDQFTYSADDALSGVVAFGCSANSGTTYPLGSTVVTCTASDAAGNSSSTSHTVTVVDTTPPAITMPADVTIEATGPTTAATFGSPSATDTVDGSVTVICSAVSGDSFAVGTHAVTCSATDANGNAASGSFTVTVTDTTAPVLTLPADFTVATTGTTAVGIFSAAAADLVDGDLPVTCSAASGDSFPIGPTTVSCSATDSHGNSSTGTFVITVCQSGRPSLELICPTVFGTADWYWKDKAAGIMTIRYRLTNGVGPDAYSVKITSSTANNGVTTLTPIPVLVGDLTSGASVYVSIDYHIPAGVRSMVVANTACADDQCGTTYYYPETP
jgi:hypothetical protein